MTNREIDAGAAEQTTADESPRGGDRRDRRFQVDDDCLELLRLALADVPPRKLKNNI